MIRQSNTISKKAILSCLVATAVVITSNIQGVKAADINSAASTASSTQLNTNVAHKFLIDEQTKSYDDINKVEKVAGFKFKVPDFLPEGFSLATYQQTKVSDNDNGVQIYFEESGKQIFGDITFQISKKDYIEALKKIEGHKGLKNDKVEAEEQDMKLGEINGKNVTLTITSPSEKIKDGITTEGFKEVFKYFVWENDGLFYSIRYNANYKNGDKANKETLNLSQENIEKIAKSIKYPEEVKSVSYAVPKRELSTETGVLEIYDKEDLESAKKLLGFNPKLPLKINDNIKINGSGVGISWESDIKNNKIYYELNSFYSNTKGSITFWEGTVSKKYDDIKKDGYYNQDIGENKAPIKITGEKLNINNKEVFKLVEPKQDERESDTVSYIWKEDNVYYSVIFFTGTENSDEIAKDFINSKPIA